MWTPKRVLLLIASFALFFTGYSVYSGFLGGIDGLTPLPEDYWPIAEGGEPQGPPPPPVNLADRKLREAFGEACPELQRTIKLDLRKRGMVLAMDEFSPSADGRVELKPCSAAIFGKPHADGGVPEINTVRCDVAYLQFDRPIKTIAEMSSAKLVGGEIRSIDGEIEVGNNRRTIQRDDDLIMHTKGPMYYVENRHWVGTRADVELTDFRSKPEPTKITATGMDLYLTFDNSNGKPGAPNPHKTKADSISGVDRIELRSNVRMDLFVDSNSGFLAPPKTATKTPPRAPGTHAPTAPPPAPAKVVITTAGPFYFDVNANHARFDIPPRQSHYPENVELKRLHDGGKVDQLFCEHLDIQFQKKQTAEADGENGDRTANLDIESAHATGARVTLTSDAEGLDAFGNDLYYDAKKHVTILKGVPEMVAMKDGNEIYAQELKLTNTDNKETQQAYARGPGHIRMLDKSNGARNVEARWTELLTYMKEDGLDCLTLIGGATFEDREHHQKIQADRLKVWLQPSEPDTAASAKKPPPPKKGRESSEADEPQQHLRPHRVEANGHVLSDSPDLKVLEGTESLTVWFKDVPPPAGTNAQTGQEPAKPAGDESGKKKNEQVVDRRDPARGTQPNPEPARAAPQGSLTTRPAAGSAAQPPKAAPAPFVGPPAPPGAAPPAEEKPKKPVSLVARTVVVHALRTGQKNELDQLTCEGMCHVHQDPSGPEDHGMDIRGETLHLNNYPDGAVLVVDGNLAHVQFDKLTILGPQVNIDQRTNNAWVDGVGVMQMLTDSNMNGDKLAKPTELTIHWKEAMHFYGKNAEFRGGVQAEQLASRLLCQELQVAFDRPISLKQQPKPEGPKPPGGKEEPKAKIDKLLCDKNVQVEEINRVDGKIQSYRRLVAPVVAVDNAEGEVTAPGPGEVRLIQLSAAGEPIPKAPLDRSAPPPKPSKPGAPPEKEEPKLTHIKFTERMQANNQRRVAIFYGNVELVNLPSDDPNLRIDLNHPPQGCLYLRCQKLIVFSHLLSDGKTRSQEMEAHQKVMVQSQDFWGLADVVKYDEYEDRVIFEAEPGGLASLYRVRVAGQQPEPVTGRKITYWRKTGLFKVDDAHGLSVGN